ncbi:MAG: right-handed parallel beta-helix repeat-containing protein, partial [Myxococcota bacterium]
MNWRLLTSVALVAALSIVGCSDDSDNGTGGAGGDGGSGGAGGSSGAGGSAPKGCDDIPDTTSYIVQGAPDTSSDNCTPELTLDATGDNDQAQILDAIDTAGANGVVCLNAGVYDMGGTVDITFTPGLTLKGIGASPDDVVLEYADGSGECRGNQGINVTVDDVTIENLWVKNTCENAVVQRGTNGSVFRKVRVSWDGTPRVENGAYGVYPTDCSNTIVEFCQTQGASDAGVYIGKCDGGSVHDNVVYENVAGLEVENCQNVETFNNE